MGANVINHNFNNWKTPNNSLGGSHDSTVLTTTATTTTAVISKEDNNIIKHKLKNESSISSIGGNVKDDNEEEGILTSMSNMNLDIKSRSSLSSRNSSRDYSSHKTTQSDKGILHSISKKEDATEVSPINNVKFTTAISNLSSLKPPQQSSPTPYNAHHATIISNNSNNQSFTKGLTYTSSLSIMTSGITKAVELEVSCDNCIRMYVSMK